MSLDDIIIRNSRNRVDGDYDIEASDPIFLLEAGKLYAVIMNEWKNPDKTELYEILSHIDEKDVLDFINNGQSSKEIIQYYNKMSEEYPKVFKVIIEMINKEAQRKLSK